MLSILEFFSINFPIKLKKAGKVYRAFSLPSLRRLILNHSQMIKKPKRKIKGKIRIASH